MIPGMIADRQKLLFSIMNSAKQEEKLWHWEHQYLVY